MAWALRFDGSNDRAELASDVTLSGDFNIEISASQEVRGRFYFSGGTSGGGFEFYINSSGRSQVFINGSGVFSGSINLSEDPDVLSKINLIRAGSTVSVYVDDVLDGTFSTSVTLKIKTISNRPAGAWSAAKLTLSYLSIDGVINLSADASDRSGSTDQPTLIDTVGGNHATGVNFPSFDPSVWVDLGGGLPDIGLTAGFTINSAFISQILSDININSNQNNTNNFSSTNSSLISLSGNQSQNNSFVNIDNIEVNNTGDFNNVNDSGIDTSSNIDITSDQQTEGGFNSDSTVEVNGTGGFNINNSLSGLKNTIIVISGNQSNSNDFDALLNVVTSGDLTLEADFNVNNGFTSVLSSIINSTTDYDITNDISSTTTSVVASSGNFNQDNNLSSNIDNSVGILGNQYTSTSSNGSINTITSSINNFNVLIDLDSVVNTEIGVNSNQEIEIGVGSLIQLEISSNSDYTINTSFTATLFVGDFNPILSDTINFSYIESNLNMGYIEVVSLRIM